MCSKLKEAKINDFEGLWNCKGHYFSVKNDKDTKEGEEYFFTDGKRKINVIVSEIQGDRIVFEIISKEAI